MSPSQIKLFMHEPALWVIKKLAEKLPEYRNPPNEYAIRGEVFADALEQAMFHGNWNRAAFIKDEIILQCDQHGLDLPGMKSIDDDWEACREQCTHMKRPIAIQKKFSCPTPFGDIRGIIDMEFDDRCVDNKYRSKSGGYEQDDKIQLACYWYATKKEQWLWKIGQGKLVKQVFENDELHEAWTVCLQNIKVMNRIVRFVHTKEEAISIIRDLPIHNPDGYWFPKAKELLKEALHGQ